MTEKNMSLVESVADDIIKLILDNHMQPGDRLPNEHALAERLKVGRSTVREAMKALRSRNILETRQGSGTYVSPKQGVPEDPLGLTLLGTDEKVGMELIEVRLIFEPEIAAMAAVNATEADIARLEAQCERVEELMRKREEYGEEDALFHTYISEASGNSILGTLVPIIMSSVKMCIQISEDAYWGSSLEWHRIVVENIRARDPHGAKWAMVNHLSTLRQGMLRKIEEKRSKMQEEWSDKSKKRFYE